jgi:uronate dehydrogenase
MPTDSQYKRVLITGAAGYLGGVLRQALRSSDMQVRLTDRSAPVYALDAGEEFVAADLASFDDVRSAVTKIDAIVHLGGQAVEAAWDTILSANIVGTYNVFEAARQVGVKRVVFASTHHVVGFYRREKTIDAHVPPRPDSRYAVSKVFGEALGRLYADKHGLSVICQRIGVARPKPPHRRALRTWLGEDDFVRLTLDCLRAPGVHFEIVYGTSANDRLFWDNEAARRIGYVPQQSAAAFEREVLAQPDAENDIEKLFQGGKFTTLEFGGDPSKID